MTGRIWLIAGPTASGKSALAIRLAEATGGEIVNADSMQLYAGLEVLTAAPGPEDRARAPHHLFGVADPADGWSTGRWLRAANDVLADLARRRRRAIVVGGTGLYFRALTQGLADVPSVAPEVRRAVARDFEAMGEPAFRVRLATADPAAAARIAPGDRQRLVRAWEVHLATGVSLTDHQARASGALPDETWTGAVLTPPRPELYARCDARLSEMAGAGAVEEVRALLARRLDPDLPAMKAVGVREFGAFLRGETTLDNAVALAQQETRRYAKRQMTWARGQMADWPRLQAADPEGQWRELVTCDPTLTP